MLTFALRRLGLRVATKDTARTTRAVNLANMPATRSATRAAAQSQQPAPEVDRDVAVKAAPTARKRKGAVAAPEAKKKARKTEVVQDEVAAPVSNHTQATPPERIATSEPTALVPAKLTFSFEVAKSHLISGDSRFEDIFNRMPCKPYEHLEQVDPFRCGNIPHESYRY